MFKTMMFEESMSRMVLASRFKINVFYAFFLEPGKIALHQGGADALRTVFGQNEQIAQHAKRLGAIFFNINDGKTKQLSFCVFRYKTAASSEAKCSVMYLCHISTAFGDGRPANLPSSV